MSKRSEQLAFVGGGNMAQSLIGGLLAHGWSATQLCVSDPIAAQRTVLSERFGVRTEADNVSAVAGADAVILAVKPQDLATVAAQIEPVIADETPLVISIAAGVRAADAGRWLGGIPVVRAMPNRPALVGCGATALYAAPAIHESGRRLAHEILAAVGHVEWIDDEAQMDAVTALSGSGPAYVFLLIEMLESAATALGLEGRTARNLAIETAWGAAQMARESGIEPATLRAQVTSKGGTTAAALAVLEQAAVRDIFRRAVAAAAARSRELAEELGRL